MSERTPFGRSPRARLRAGRFMRWLAVLGVFTSIGGVVAGWHLLGQIDTTLSDSLEITGDSLVALEDTIELADGLLESVDDALIATEESLRAVVTSTDDAVTVIDTVDDLVTEISPALANVESALRGLADVGTTIDNVLEQLDDIPFGPNYNPDQTLGEQLDRLADDIAPVVDSLDDATEPLGELAGASSELESEITALADAVSAVNRELQSSDVLLDSYLATAQRAQLVAADADADLGDEIARTRIFVVLAGLLIGLGQIVPWWVGNELIVAARDEQSRHS